VACIGIGSGPIHLGPVDFLLRAQKIKESRSNLNIYTSARFPLMPRRESDRVVGALMPGNAGGAKGPDF
jgi:hypothetical protein